MIDLPHETPRSMAAVMAADAHEAAGQSRLARFFRFAHVLVGKPVPTFPGHALSAALLRALHESRRRQGERELGRYWHLICMDETHPDLNLLRRTCRSAKNSG
jgi:hypothetical protein